MAAQAQIDWREFFTILTMHQAALTIDPWIATELDDHQTNALARRVSMVGLPIGNANGISFEAHEWRRDTR